MLYKRTFTLINSGGDIKYFLASVGFSYEYL